MFKDKIKRTEVLKMSKKITTIFEDGVYYEGDEYYTQTDKYVDFFYDSLKHMRKLGKTERLQDLWYDDEQGKWVAEVWSMVVEDIISIDVDQSIFKQLKAEEA